MIPPGWPYWGGRGSFTRIFSKGSFGRRCFGREFFCKEIRKVVSNVLGPKLPCNSRGMVINPIAGFIYPLQGFPIEVRMTIPHIATRPWHK